VSRLGRTAPCGGHWWPRDQGAVINTLGWIIVVAAAWLVVATAVGVLVGGMIRERDRQVPPPPAEVSEDERKENQARGRQQRK
jgi:hypothetical protein